MKRKLFFRMHLCTCFLSAAASACPVPQAQWLLDEGSGIAAYDSSPNHYHGILYDSLGWQTDFWGDVLNFDGTNDFVEASGYTGIPGTQARTVCAWIKTTQLSGAILTYGSAGAGTRWLFILDGNGKLQLGISGGNIISTQVVADGQWHHAAAVLEAPAEGPTRVGHLRLYIDGRPAAGTFTNPDTEIDTVLEYPVRIGVIEGPAGTLSGFFAGRIRDMRLYDSALSASQVYAVFRRQVDLTGAGTRDYPYKVKTPDQLISIGSDSDLLTKHYILAYDIAFSPDSNPLHVFDRAVIAPSLNDRDPAAVFSGTFDGNGYSISNLKIAAGSNAGPVGLFGYVAGEQAEIRNLRLINVLIQANRSYPTGGLIGRNGQERNPAAGGAVTNCQVFGTITSASPLVGGLIGEHYGSAIRDCRSECTISGADLVGGLCGIVRRGSLTGCEAGGAVSGVRYVGGLCGQNYGGMIRRCFAEDSVSGTGPYCGGLCGGTYSTNIIFGDNDSWPIDPAGFITDSYALGDVTGTGSFYGGLCGDAYGLITNCYSAGQVGGLTPRGGLCGISNGGRFENCFWDTQTSGLTNGAGAMDPDPSGVVGLTTEQMMQRDSFTGWDFADDGSDGPNNIWRMCEEAMDYPRLSWEYGQDGDFACPDGVGLEDLEALTFNWLTADSRADFDYACDGNMDGFIGQKDLNLLSQNWLAGLWADPVIRILPQQVVFRAAEGGNHPNGRSVIVKNTGSGILEWSIQSEEPIPDWLSIDPVSGTLGRGESSSLTIGIDITGLAAGTYIYTFDIVDPTALNSPQTVTITLIIAPPLPAPAAYWAMDEDSGSVASDSSGNEHHGTLVNFADPDGSWTAGKVENCLTFDGSNDHAAAFEYQGIGGGQSRTVCAWIRTTHLSGGILNYGNVGTGTRWIFFVNENGKLQLGISGGNLISTQVVTDGQWRHVAAVLETPAEGPTRVQHLRLYIDGQLAEGTHTNPDTEISTVLEYPVRIGVIEGPAGALGSYFNGLIDEVRMYDAVLSEDQIALLALE